MSPTTSRHRKTVHAAGALVWRENSHGHLEVLLVHRPRYDDWSIPKGKVNRRESLRACAVREVAEETGIDVVLGQPLEQIHYQLPDGSMKEVSYWAGVPADPDSRVLNARTDVSPASVEEIDGVRWVEVTQARTLLTHDVDRTILGILVDQWEDGKLHTWALVLVRHARAVKRSVWNKGRDDDESTRPLTADQGKQRSHALVPILSAYGVDNVMTSPWKRCLDTLAPYVEASQCPCEVRDELTEAAHHNAVHDVRHLVEDVLLGEHGSLALCTHRPVLPTVMEVIADHTPHRLLRAVPNKDPWLKTGEILVIHFAHRPGKPTRAVAIEKQRPVLHEWRS